MSTVAIIGGGVIGLSTAWKFQQKGIPVVVIARTFPSPFETVDGRDEINYSSQWAGAHNRYIPPFDEASKRDHDFALETFRHMDALAKESPEAGITFMKGIEYLEAGISGYDSLTNDKARDLGYEDFKEIDKKDLPEGVVRGFEYRTWCVNPMVYCSYLLRRLFVGGCKFIKRHLRTPEEVFSMHEVGDIRAVVNCSGIGFGDEKVFVTRGQTCLVANACDATVTRQNSDGTWSFSVPRNFHGGTIIGGTKEVDDWRMEPSSETRARLLKNFAATYPKILEDGGEFRVLRDIVGRRPTRVGGLRLEKVDSGHGNTVIHLYGLGGRGYELSWGVAEAAFKLLEEN
ncbi:hypothetical protein jhhlp_001028 [Lomentospora prolificans]|uniref:FAD dependent oxidoreductase domain-containing protein n=1 Tax=Lomentospora prolificans TaxID=41688 RepID=A0A2N3NK38_9PEZI|nr:hypothetical protein jhhlp_001028 [Lomentospora prolificans]